MAFISPFNYTYAVFAIITAFLGLCLKSCGQYLINRFPLHEGCQDSQIREIQSLARCNKTAAALATLVAQDGAGAWPPKCDHDRWPSPLRPYKKIYLELAPLLAAVEPSLDDAENMRKRQRYRSLMRALLSTRVSVADVESLLRLSEGGDETACPLDSYNGFYCCIAVLRHAYRWATIPVVKVAQQEKTVDLPRELEVPWPYLQRHFGVTADCGNNTANVLLNFDERENRVYRINVGLGDPVASSEETFFRIFRDVEIIAWPIYYSMVRAIVSFEAGHKGECLEEVKRVVLHQRRLTRLFHESIQEERVSRTVWLSYVQGFQGWGAGRVIDGDFVQFNGVSGNHVLVFQALDAFLGLDRYLADEDMERYIPANQRHFCAALKEASLRSRVQLGYGGDDKLDAMIESEMGKLAQQMRVFRAGHRTRVMPYLEQPAPERLIMTAGKSVLEKPGSNAGLRDVLKPLDDMMAKRLLETV